jgi:hypothetical protein
MIPAERELLQRLADGERRLIATCERLGIGWTILRPTLIYAEGRDDNISRLARLIGKFGVLPLMGSGAWPALARACGRSGDRRHRRRG